jgi:hypothetical protein
MRSGSGLGRFLAMGAVLAATLLTAGVAIPGSAAPAGRPPAWRAGLTRIPTGAAGAPAISADGRVVAYPSAGQVWATDLTTGRTELVSQRAPRAPRTPGATPVAAPGGTRAGVVPAAAPVAVPPVPVAPPGAAGAEREPDGPQLSLSADGRLVAFVSDAAGLVPGIGGGVARVYLRDRATRRTSLVSADRRGRPLAAPARDPRISGDGRWIAFTAESAAPYQDGTTPAGRPGSELWLRDRLAAGAAVVPLGGGGVSTGSPALSGDGEVLAGVVLTCPDRNCRAGGGRTILTLDRRSGRVARVPAAVDPGRTLDLRVSLDWPGRRVAFEHGRRVLVADRTRGRVIEAAGPDDGAVRLADLSSNGRWLAFTSDTGAGGRTLGGLFLRDLRMHGTVRVTHDESCTAAAGAVPGRAQLAAGARRVVFTADARLTAADPDRRPDVHVRDRRGTGEACG